MKKRIFAVTAACVMAFGVSSALAASTSVTIKLNGSGSKLQGAVKSSKSSCEQGRKVKLYYSSGTGFSKVADDHSSSSGAWSIKGPGGSIPPGNYYVTVKKTDKCDGAKSEKSTVQG